MKKRMNLFQVLALYIAVIIMLFMLFGCDLDEEDLQCPVEDRYIFEYQEIVYPSGDIVYKPIYKCP